MRKLLRFVPILALACQGELFDFPLPGDRPGTGQPPTPFTPGLAFRFGGPGGDFARAMVTDPAGGIVLAGTFSGTADFEPGPGITPLNSGGGIDGFLVRYSSAGVPAWARGFGGARDERVTALARDPAGNVYVGGSFEGNATFGLPTSAVIQSSAGGADGFVAKYASDGQFLWVRRIGGAGLDEVTTVTVDAAGIVYAGGEFNGTANAQPAAGITIQSNGLSDGFVLSLTPDGAVRWVLPIGGPQADAVAGVAATASDRLVVAGTFRSTADFARNGGVPGSLLSLGGADVFLAVYSASSALERVRAVGGLDDETVTGGGLTLDAADRPVVLGSFTGSVDFDPGPGATVRISQAGTGSGESDAFVARYDGNGDFLSVATLGGTGAVTAARALPTLDGGVVVTGGFAGSIDFDPQAAVSILTSFGRQGATDAFAVRFSAAATLVWADQVGESTTISERLTTGAAVGVDPLGNLLLAGSFFGSPDFDPGATAFRLTSVGEADGFVVKLTPSGAISP